MSDVVQWRLIGLIAAAILGIVVKLLVRNAVADRFARAAANSAACAWIVATLTTDMRPMHERDLLTLFRMTSPFPETDFWRALKLVACAQWIVYPMPGVVSLHSRRAARDVARFRILSVFVADCLALKIEPPQ